MMSLMKTPDQVRMELAKRISQRRLDLNLSREGLAERSGVPFSTLRAFEREGKVSLENLLKLASALGQLDAFENLFRKTPDEISQLSLDDILAEEKQRQRGRIK